MSKVTLDHLGYYDKTKTPLDQIGLFDMAFEILPTYPLFVIEFLSTFTLRLKQY